MKKTIQSHRFSNKTSRDMWVETYDPGNGFKVNPYDYDNVDDYLDALREDWKEKYDSFDEYSYIDVEDYDSLEEYQEAIED